MEREMTVSVKLEAKDEVLMVPRTMVLRSAAMESRGTVSVKCEPIDEILTVPRAVVNGHYEPACHLCGCAERDIEEALGLGKEASDISADVLLANMHIKKEQEDISDQKVIADLLAVHKFCDRAEGEGEQQQQQQQDEGDGLIACRFCDRTKEEEREMIAGLLAEADSIGADVLLSDTQIKREPQDIKDPKVTEDLLGFCKFCDIEDKELALALQPECSNVEEATRQLSGNNRSMWSVLKKHSGVCGEAVAHPAQKCATPEDRQFVKGSGPLQVPDVNRSGGGEGSACGSYTCSSCSATFSSKYRLVRHVFVHIGGVRPPPHVCRLCGDVFRTGGSLRVHLKRGECVAVAGCSVADSAGDRRLSGTRRISPGNSLAPTVDGIEEKVCNRARQPSTCTGRTTQTEKSKQKHRNGDCGKSPQSAFEPGQNSSARKRKQQRPSVCSFCHKILSDPSCLKRHELIHTQKKQFHCVDCGKHFTQARYLQKHRKTHSESTQFTCNECGRSFKRSDTLLKHRLVHSEVRPYRCGDCGKTFKLRGYLLHHTRIHVGEKPYECDDCGVSFMRPYSLVEHRRQHSGDRPFECNVCSATFIRAVTLREHKRIHTGERPHVCGNCGETFSRAAGLRKHRQLSVAEMLPKCDDCNKSFEFDDLLKQLVVMRTEGRSHQCINCGKSFVRPFELTTPYECSYCGEIFCRITAFRKHGVIHVKKKLYACVGCGNTYKRRDNLRRHQKMASCGNSFVRVDVAKKKAYECVNCGKSFDKARSLRRHHRKRSCKSKDSVM